MRLAIAFIAGGILLLCAAVPATADESGMVDASHYYGLTGVVSRIHSGMVFVQPPVGLQARAISPRLLPNSRRDSNGATVSRRYSA